MTPAPQCIHECVCSFYKARNGECCSEPCDLNTHPACPYGSTITSAEQMLEKLKKRCQEYYRYKGGIMNYGEVMGWIEELRAEAR